MFFQVSQMFVSKAENKTECTTLQLPTMSVRSGKDSLETNTLAYLLWTSLTKRISIVACHLLSMLQTFFLCQ
jgi:hypothetical protein